MSELSKWFGRETATTTTTTPNIGNNNNSNSMDSDSDEQKHASSPPTTWASTVAANLPPAFVPTYDNWKTALTDECKLVSPDTPSSVSVLLSFRDSTTCASVRALLSNPFAASSNSSSAPNRHSVRVPLFSVSDNAPTIMHGISTGWPTALVDDRDYFLSATRLLAPHITFDAYGKHNEYSGFGVKWSCEPAHVHELFQLNHKFMKGKYTLHHYKLVNGKQTCTWCWKPGHSSRDCSHRRTQVHAACDKCYSFGHQRENCTNPAASCTLCSGFHKPSSCRLFKPQRVELTPPAMHNQQGRRDAELQPQPLPPPPAIPVQHSNKRIRPVSPASSTDSDSSSDDGPLTLALNRVASTSAATPPTDSTASTPGPDDRISRELSSLRAQTNSLIDLCSTMLSLLSGCFPPAAARPLRTSEATSASTLSSHPTPSVDRTVVAQLSLALDAIKSKTNYYNNSTFVPRSAVDSFWPYSSSPSIPLPLPSPTSPRASRYTTDESATATAIDVEL
jgi:hypothetical protein